MKKMNEEKINYITRLKRIEGQIKGIEQMIEKDRSYSDVAIQILSAEKALKSLNRNLVRNHLKNDSLAKLNQAQMAEVEEVLNWFDKIN